MSYVPPHKRDGAPAPATAPEPVPDFRNKQDWNRVGDDEQPQQTQTQQPQQGRFDRQPQQQRGYGGGYNNNSWNNNGGGYGGYQNGGGYQQNSYGGSYGGGRGRGRGRHGGYGGRGGGYGGGYHNGGYGGRGGGRFDRGPIHSEYNAMRQGSKKQDDAVEKELFHKRTMNQGINFDDYDLVNVEVGNYDLFQPIETFETSNLHPLLLNNIKLCGFTKPTPIQKYAIPPVIACRDLMSCAQTGSGKTAAFLLPIIHNLLAYQIEEVFHARSKSYPKAVIISPTRELAQQIHGDATKFLYRTGMGAACIFGGSSVQKQLSYLKSYQIDVLVATVGRMWDFYERGALSFEDVHYLVLDEADRMLDMGFEKDIMKILHDSDLRKQRTNLLFSATMPPEIQRVAAEFMTDYIFLACGRVGGVGKLIDQNFEQVPQHGKTDALLAILGHVEGRVLVFTATKRKADELEYELNQQHQEEHGRRAGKKCIAIHGDKSQHAREKALNLFRKGRVQVMIATDVAARGLDVPNVMFVVQYDLPDNIDSYVHRIGRTGRCGNKGTAIAFVNDRNGPILKELIQLLKDEEIETPDWLLQMSRNNWGGKKKYYGGRGRGGRRNNYGRGRGGGRRHNNRNNNFNRQQW